VAVAAAVWTTAAAQGPGRGYDREVLDSGCHFKQQMRPAHLVVKHKVLTSSM